MKRLFKIIKIVALLLALLAAGIGLLLFFAFRGNLPIQDGQRLGAVEVVKDGFVAAYIVAMDDKNVVLVDAGNDRGAKAILLALARRNLSPDSVKAILLTHGDRDHVAGLSAFPGATVMALESETALVEGREARGILKYVGKAAPSGIKVGRVLHDGETVDLGGLPVRVFAVPGHTKGSAAFLLSSVLFLGDSAGATSDGKLAPGSRLFTESPAENRKSLQQLAARLGPLAGEIKAIACGHAGILDGGIAPLFELGSRLAAEPRP